MMKCPRYPVSFGQRPSVVEMMPKLRVERTCEVNTMGENRSFIFTYDV